MRFTIPVSRHDVDNLTLWLEVLKKFGGLEAHNFIFVPGRSVQEAAKDAAAELAPICAGAEVRVMEMDPEGGWPFAPNFQFYDAVNKVDNDGEFWMWMELDALPVRDRWADMLAQEYMRRRSPFLGSVVPTPYRDGDKIIPSPEGPDDVMMCGCGIYPAYMLSAPNMKPHLQALFLDFTKGMDSIDSPWDVHLRYAMRRIGMGSTDLIADMWNTCNYQNSEEGLTCSPAESKFVSRARGGLVPSQAVVVHGCKDRSLAELLLSGAQIKRVEPKVDTPAAESAKVASLEAQIAEMKEMMQKLMGGMAVQVAPVQTSTAPAVATPAPEPVIPEPAPQAPPTPEIPLDPKERSILDAIKAKPSDKGLRVVQLSTSLGIPIQEIRDMAKKPDSKFSVSGPGWCTLKAS